MDREELLIRITRVARAELALPEDVVLTDTTRLDEVARLSSVRLMAFVEGLEVEFDIDFDVESLSGDAVVDVAQLLPMIERELG